MLKFNKYPPENPEDVELTPGAQLSFEDAAEADQYERLFAYGESLGRVITAATLDVKLYEEEPPQPFKLAERIFGVIDENMIDFESRIHVMAGFREGALDEMAKGREV